MNTAIGEISQSRQVRGLALFLGLAWLVWVLANWIVTGSTQYLVIGSMIIAMIMVTVGILKDWRSGLLFFILWLLFEDLARKYLGNGTLLFFGKDILAAIIYVSIFTARQRNKMELFRPPFLVPLAIFFALAFVQVFNTQAPSPLYGLLGLKLYFYYVPLMFAGYALLRSKKDLDRFLIFSVALGLLIASLGIIQSVVGLQFLNPATLAPELEALGNLTRISPITHRAVPVPSSVFVSGGRYASYMILLIILAMGAQAYMLLTRRRRSIYGFLGIGLALVGAMQSGSRGTIIYATMSIFAVSAGLLWGAPWRWGQGHRLAKAVRRSILVGAMGLFLMVQFFPNSIGSAWAFYFETLSPTSSANELQHRAWDYPLLNLTKALQSPRWLIGFGTGSASLGMQYVDRLLGQRREALSVENGYGTLILEMGIMGLVLWIFWTTTLLLYAWKIVRGLRETVYFPVGFAIFWYSFMLLVPFTYLGINTYQNFVMNAYFWILIGVLFRLPHLARVPQVVPAKERVARIVGLQPVFGRR